MNDAQTAQELLTDAAARGLIPGGVLLTGTSAANSVPVCFGALRTDGPAVTPATRYDLASLTKVVATLPAVLQLTSILGMGGPAAPQAPVTQESLAAEEELVSFVSFVLDDAQALWAELFRASDVAYEEAELVLFRSSVSSASSRELNDRKDAISMTPRSVSCDTSGNATACAGGASPRPEDTRR